MSDEKKTPREQFPEATVAALWQAVELMSPDMLRRRECEEQGLDPSRWCPRCRARRLLQNSHEYQEQVRLFRPRGMSPDDPGLTPREKLLCAVQGFADAWRSGEVGAVRQAKTALVLALDAHEFGVSGPWEDLARELTGAPRGLFGDELREQLRAAVVGMRGRLAERETRDPSRAARDERVASACLEADRYLVSVGVPKQSPEIVGQIVDVIAGCGTRELTGVIVELDRFMRGLPQSICMSPEVIIQFMDSVLVVLRGRSA